MDEGRRAIPSFERFNFFFHFTVKYSTSSLSYVTNFERTLIYNSNQERKNSQGIELWQPYSLIHVLELQQSQRSYNLITLTITYVRGLIPLPTQPNLQNALPETKHCTLKMHCRSTSAVGADYDRLNNRRCGKKNDSKSFTKKQPPHVQKKQFHRILTQILTANAPSLHFCAPN